MDSVLICQTTSANSKNAHPPSICQVFVIFQQKAANAPQNCHQIYIKISQYGTWEQVPNLEAIKAKLYFLEKAKRPQICRQ